MIDSKRGFTTSMFVALGLFPLIADPYGMDLVTKTMIFALFALSLELLVGSVGLVCFGQSAFFGIGAYSVVLLNQAGLPNSLLLTVFASALLSGLSAVLIGALSLRSSGVYFIMATLAFAQMAYYVIHDTPLGGGTDGIYLNEKLTIGSLMSLDGAVNIYAVTFALLAATFGWLSLILRSRFGRTLVGIKSNEQRMRATGYSTYYYKLAAFTISGSLAGIAGCLFAIKDGFVNPELLSWHMSGTVLIIIILGGIGHLHGAIVGAFAFMLLQEFFKSEAIWGEWSKHWHLGLGISIILFVALMPRGIVGIPAQIRNRLIGRNLDRKNGLSLHGQNAIR